MCDSVSARFTYLLTYLLASTGAEIRPLAPQRTLARVGREQRLRHRRLRPAPLAGRLRDEQLPWLRAPVLGAPRSDVAVHLARGRVTVTVRVRVRSRVSVWVRISRVAVRARMGLG